MKNQKRLRSIIIISVIFLGLILFLLYYFNLTPQKSHNNADFNIKAYKSNVDYDKDGIDDQTDILQSARKYINTNPTYKSKYYNTGYPNDGYGVCTDVVAQAFVGAGYNFMDLVNDDILKNRDDYNIETVDKNIDFRRVRNLKVFFKNNAASLTTDVNDIAQWQGGDIVIFTDHIAIVSDKRNKDGVPYLIHNAGQPKLEEDAMGRYEIVGHYRWK